MNVDAESEKAAKRHQKLLDDAKLDAIPGWLGVIVDGLLVCWILGLNVILAIFEVVMLAGLWLMGITKRSKKTK